MSDERLRELLEVQAYFGLPSPALVEKDLYVVKALAAIAAIKTEPLRLVFSGGTALSRAHRLVRRMSLSCVCPKVVSAHRCGFRISCVFISPFYQIVKCG